MLQSADCTVLSFQKHSWMMKHILETAVLLILLLHSKAFHLPHRQDCHRDHLRNRVMQDLSLTAAVPFWFRGFHAVGERINSIATCNGFGAWWKNWLKNMHLVPWWVGRGINCVAITRSFHQTLHGGCCLLLIAEDQYQKELWLRWVSPFCLTWWKCVMESLARSVRI